MRFFPHPRGKKLRNVFVKSKFFIFPLFFYLEFIVKMRGKEKNPKQHIYVNDENVKSLCVGGVVNKRRKKEN